MAGRGGFPLTPPPPEGPSAAVSGAAGVPSPAVPAPGSGLLRGPSPAGAGTYRPMGHGPPFQRPGMLPGGRMPMAGLQVGSPSGPPYGTASSMRPGMPPSLMDPFRKRLLVPQAQTPQALTQRRGNIFCTRTHRSTTQGFVPSTGTSPSSLKICHPLSP